MKALEPIVSRFTINAFFGFLFFVLCLSGCTNTQIEVTEASRGLSTATQKRNLTARYNPLSIAPHIINVSEYDPKERQRSGSYYTPNDLTALRRNGALGLIARCGKGKHYDKKCASFLAAAERQRMLLGSYYFVVKGIDPVWQADRFVNRIQSIKSSLKLRSPEILLVGDFDSRSSVTDIIRFINRIEIRTGQRPMIYLENSDHLRRVLSSATSSQKRRIAQCPYWIALYSSKRSGMETPEKLMREYGIWNRWSLWQYSGVYWDKSRSKSVIHNYNYGRYRSSSYFGNMSCPLERNIFNGTVEQLYGFWDNSSWKW